MPCKNNLLDYYILGERRIILSNIPPDRLTFWRRKARKSWPYRPPQTLFLIMKSASTILQSPLSISAPKNILYGNQVKLEKWVSVGTWQRAPRMYVTKSKVASVSNVNWLFYFQPTRSVYTSWKGPKSILEWAICGCNNIMHVIFS